MSKKSLILLSAALIALGILIVLHYAKEDKEFELVARERSVKVPRAIESTQVGTGWSNKTDPREAVRQALGVAMSGKREQPPDVAIIFATSGSDMRAILGEARQALGNRTKIYGGTSDSRGVMTNEGFIATTARAYADPSAEDQHALAIMTLSSKEIVFGVGSANCSDYASAQQAAREAILKAIASAGKQPQETPRLVLVTLPRSLEEEALEGIEEVVGPKTALLGGTPGGPRFAVFGEDEVYENGVSLLAMYTDLPVGHVFEGGFDVKQQHSGIVTKVDGPAILEIDNRPALDVYDEWLDGHIAKSAKELNDPKAIRTLLNLHPIYRKYTSSDGQDYFLFSHPWPKDESLKTRAVMTSTKIKVGERVYLSSGSWQTFLNRIGKLPVKAKVGAEIGGGMRPIFGVGYICSGVMGVIPESERTKMPFLINYNTSNAPFIATFTWGEQGHFPGIGNKHGNLLTGFVIVAGGRSQ